MNGESTHVLLPAEAEAYVESLDKVEMKNIGSTRWVQQHEYIEKLNMQAAVSASSNGDEFIKEFLITYEKIPVLIHELLATEAWKQFVFPEFVAQNLQPKVSFPMYIVLYHEATTVNLLETVLYHRDACEALNDTALDLLDYCYRKLTHLIAQSGQEHDQKETSEATPLEELQGQNKKLNFDICIKAVSVLRYIIDHLSVVPLSVSTRALCSLDLPVLLVQLIENPPWSREKNGKMEKYIDNKWHEVTNEDRFKITKIEGQVWLSLYQLLMTEDCQKRYELDNYRKNVIMKLRSYVSEMLVDQLPVLGDLRRYLEQLSFMEAPSAKQELILEQLPELREAMLREYEGKWKKLAQTQHKTHFNVTDQSVQQQASRLAETYDMAVLESLLTEPPKCAVCGEAASKRCSRCQNEWYCRRECQVSHWKKHKKVCDMLATSTQDSKATS